jgi:predicted dinucleotide-binding enzyme
VTLSGIGFANIAETTAVTRLIEDADLTWLEGVDTDVRRDTTAALRIAEFQIDRAGAACAAWVITDSEDKMKIGIMGAGKMGAAFAHRLAAADHEVAIAAQGLDEARKVANEVGHRVRAVPREELAEGTDLLILATPYGASVDALRAVRNTDGKTVIDISNPLNQDMSGLVVGHTTSAAEEIQRGAPRVKIVKAFNTVFSAVLASQPGGESKVQVFYAGDDAGAKDAVRRLVESVGFEPVDAGPLVNARYLEPLGMLNIWLGYMGGRGTNIAPRWAPATSDIPAGV